MVEEKILIVDDNEEVIEKTRSLLVEVGYDVTSCNSGKDALEFWRTTRSISYCSISTCLT